MSAVALWGLLTLLGLLTLAAFAGLALAMAASGADERLTERVRGARIDRRTSD